MSSNYPERSLQVRLLERHQQRGATLVVALVVVLLVVMLATRLGGTYLVLFRTVENQTAVQQARVYLRGAEVVAKEALLRDLQADSEVDSMLEFWAQPLAIPLPEGILSACLVDLQSRLNLNDLGTGAGENNGEYSPAQKRFIRLLQALDLEEPLDSLAAVALAHAVFDWRDTDYAPRYPGGAEELEYLRQTPPYRPANQAFASVTELNLIKGMTPELVVALTPHLSVWGNGNINLNTLDAALTASAATGAEAPQPMLLRTLNNPDSLQPLTPEAAALLAQARSAQGGVLRNLDMFANGPLAAQQWELEGVGFTTEYFLLTADMQVQARHYQLQSVLRRVPDAVGVPQLTVLSRHYGSAEFTMDDYCAAALP